MCQSPHLQDGSTALIYAANPHTYPHLPSQDGSTALMYASGSSATSAADVVDKLLKSGASVDIKDGVGGGGS